MPLVECPELDLYCIRGPSEQFFESNIDIQWRKLPSSPIFLAFLVKPFLIQQHCQTVHMYVSMYIPQFNMLTQKHSCWSSCSTTSITSSTSKSSKSSLNSTTEPSILTITSGYMKLLYAFPAPPHSEPSPIYIYINIVFASFPADIMGLFRFILFCRGTCRFFQKY